MIDEAADIVKRIVDSMDSTIIGQWDGDYTISCETKWARKGKIVSQAGEEFLINSIEYDQEISATYIGSTIPAPRS